MYVSLFSQQIIISTAVFNIDDKKNVSSKSAYYTDFWRSCDTEDSSNDAEKAALHPRNKLYFKIYYNRKQLF